MNARTMFDHCAGQQRYFDTTNLPYADWQNAIAVATQQDELVMAIFRVHGQRAQLGPSRVHQLGLWHGHRWLLTSVRRSMSVLTKSGQLIKTDCRSTGPHGRAETTWRLPTQTSRSSTGEEK